MREVRPEAALQSFVHAVLLSLDEAAHQLPASATCNRGRSDDAAEVAEAACTQRLKASCWQVLRTQRPPSQNAHYTEHRRRPTSLHHAFRNEGAAQA